MGPFCDVTVFNGPRVTHSCGPSSRGRKAEMTGPVCRGCRWPRATPMGSGRGWTWQGSWGVAQGSPGVKGGSCLWDGLRTAGLKQGTCRLRRKCKCKPNSHAMSLVTAVTWPVSCGGQRLLGLSWGPPAAACPHCRGLGWRPHVPEHRRADLGTAGGQGPWTRGLSPRRGHPHVSGQPGLEGPVILTCTAGHCPGAVSRGDMFVRRAPAPGLTATVLSVGWRGLALQKHPCPHGPLSAHLGRSF